ncbi:MAG: hypothetical protein ACOX8E_12375 [Ruminococcus sp.]|jgi:hypothetical protein
METEQKQSHTLTHNGVLSPARVSSEMDDIFVEIERAWAICSDICSGYFGCTKEYYQKYPCFLMEHYDKTRLFVEVVTDYLYHAKIMMSALIESIGEVPGRITEMPDGGENHKYSTIMEIMRSIENPEYLELIERFARGLMS